MSKNIVQTAQYELDVEEGQPEKVIKFKKWSISKLYSMLDAISIVLQKIDVKFTKDDYGSQEIGRIISKAAQAANAQLTHIILESVSKDHKLTAEEIGTWVPEDYIGILTKILELNLTPQLIKNLRSLQTAFMPQGKQ